MLITFSKGITRTPHIAEFLAPDPLINVRPGKYIQATGVAGWGRKATADHARRYADAAGLPYIALEDGFLRSVGLGGTDGPYSIVVDNVGVYYDAANPSRLEALVAAPLSVGDTLRANALLAAWRAARCSKYNHLREYEGLLADDYVLVADQTCGDCSVTYGLADAGSFKRMLQAALDENPGCTVLVKIHPDVFAGKKKGYFDPAQLAGMARVRVLADDVHPVRLIERARAVYCVTSQIGFEALLWGRPVRTFGMPFYAGWGLTRDDLPPPARRRPVALAQLVYAALIGYPRYIDPETGQRCEAERLVAWMGLQRRLRQTLPADVYAWGFSRWKRPIVRDFLQGSRVRFVRSPAAVPAGGTLLVWGARPVPLEGHLTPSPLVGEGWGEGGDAARCLIDSPCGCSPLSPCPSPTRGEGSKPPMRFATVSGRDLPLPPLGEDVRGGNWEGGGALPVVTPQATVAPLAPTLPSPSVGGEKPSAPTTPSEGGRGERHLTPSPLVGEGWGEGGMQQGLVPAAPPSPLPLPHRGGGEIQVLRVEDGFLRSVGLGADLVRPVSWVIDDEGIYFDATRASRLERLLAETDFDAALLARAAALRQKLVAARLTKYNVGNADGRVWRRPAGARRVILAPGQVEGDASLRYGAPALRGNAALLQAVRAANPDALVVYKPHPDVAAGLRGDKTHRATLAAHCDVWLDDVPMAALLGEVDEVHTLTSLTGFEALLRGKRVVCYGQPFYAGWGLTADIAPLPAGRRGRVLPLDALVAAALILYPRYLSRRSGRFVEVETVLEQLLAWRDAGVSVMPPWRRALRGVLALAASIRGR